MTRKVRRSHKSVQPKYTMHFIAAFLAALVGLTAWAHQQGLIDWQLPAFLANAVASTDTGPAMGAVQGASQSNCPEQFLGGAAPALTNDKLRAKTRELCYTGFAVLNSGVTLTPLWAAEHLTAQRVEAARALVRVDSFHADENLPAGERADLADYKGYPYDRGHMAPNGDMPDERSQAECFTLANIVPQDADNNRGIWSSIEQTVRGMAEKDGDVYVVTGPIFAGDDLKQLNDRVFVPTQIFKAVYDVKKHQAAAYLVNNVPGHEYEIITIAKLQMLSGIQVFPGLPADATSELSLPMPSGHKG